jgi:LysM repeat protein
MKKINQIAFLMLIIFSLISCDSMAQPEPATKDDPAIPPQDSQLTILLGDTLLIGLQDSIVVEAFLLDYEKQDNQGFEGYKSIVHIPQLIEGDAKYLIGLLTKDSSYNFTDDVNKTFSPDIGFRTKIDSNYLRILIDLKAGRIKFKYRNKIITEKIAIHNDLIRLCKEKLFRNKFDLPYYKKVNKSYDYYDTWEELLASEQQQTEEGSTNTIDATTGYEPQNIILHRVNMNETLGKIAKNYKSQKVTAADIKRINDLQSNELEVNQELKIELYKFNHTVKNGETLKSIVELYGIEVRVLIQQNTELNKNSELSENQKLKIKIK